MTNPTKEEKPMTTIPDKSEERWNEFKESHSQSTQSTPFIWDIAKKAWNRQQQQITALQGELEEARIGQAKFHEQGMHCNELQSELLDAQAACAVKDEALRAINEFADSACDEGSAYGDRTQSRSILDVFVQIDKALSTDCGKAMLEEVERLRGMLSVLEKDNGIFGVDPVKTAELTLSRVNDLGERLRLAEVVIEHARTSYSIVDHPGWDSDLGRAILAYDSHTRDGIQSPEVLPQTLTESCICPNDCPVHCPISQEEIDAIRGKTTLSGNGCGEEKGERV